MTAWERFSEIISQLRSCSAAQRGQWRRVVHEHTNTRMSMASIDGLQLTVIQGKVKHAVTCPGDSTVLQLKQQIQELSGVSPSSQKLIFKGKERKDAETLSAAGVANGDKLMLMLSPEGVKELKKEEERIAGEKRKQEAADAQKLKENHRDGVVGDDQELNPTSTSKTTVIEEEGAGVKGTQVVQVVHTKVRYRLVADITNSSFTFLNLKEKLAKLCHVPAKHQRLIFKGKERDSSQTLAAAGVKAGDKMMLLLAEGEWKVRDEKELIRDVEAELTNVEERVRKLKSQCEHGMFGNDVTEISVQAGFCFEAFERLSDNVSYLAHVPEAAAVQEVRA